MPYEPDKPWERQNGESGQAYEAFVLYRDAGKGRTVSAVVKRLGKSRTLLDRWKAKWKWEERVTAYDNEIERQAKEKAVKDQKKMLDRHIKIAMQVQQKALKALDEMDVQDMTPRDIREYIRLGTELERLSRTFDVGGQEETAASKGETLADAIMAAYQKRKDGSNGDK